MKSAEEVHLVTNKRGIFLWFVGYRLSCSLSAVRRQLLLVHWDSNNFAQVLNNAAEVWYCLNDFHSS